MIQEHSMPAAVIRPAGPAPVQRPWRQSPNLANPLPPENNRPPSLPPANRLHLLPHLHHRHLRRRNLLPRDHLKKIRRRTRRLRSRNHSLDSLRLVRNAKGR